MIGNRLQTPRRRSRMSLDSFLEKLLAANATSEVRPCDTTGKCECAAQQPRRLPPKLYPGGPSAVDVLGICCDHDHGE